VEEARRFKRKASTMQKKICFLKKKDNSTRVYNALNKSRETIYKSYKGWILKENKSPKRK